jgi:hypothetical protein
MATPLTYTQHTVAFPKLSLDNPLIDEVNVGLPGSEFRFSFMDLSNVTPRLAVQMQVFGDGLPCLFDERVQRVVEAWRSMPDPDEMTPDMLIALLLANGAVPSRYHQQGASR